MWIFCLFDFLGKRQVEPGEPGTNPSRGVLWEWLNLLKKKKSEWTLACCEVKIAFIIS